MSAVSARLPVTQNPDNPSDLVRAQPICNPDGTNIGGGTASNPNDNPATIYTAQQKTTAAAAALAAKALVNGVVLTARSTNAASVIVGFDNTVTTATDGTGLGYPLTPGQSISFGVTNANAIFIIGSNTTDVLYIAGN